jgi:hypothetical protein
MTGRLVIIAAVLSLAACDPQELADKTIRRAADSVIMPVVSRDLTAGQAQAATYCLLDAASGAELQSLARDVGVEAGTLTVQTIRTIAARPAAMICLTATGITALQV